jgi:PAS domain S-box-containing protein
MVISAALAIYGWRRRTIEAGPFSLLMGAVALWSLCHTLSVASPTLGQALFWAQVQYAGIVAVGPAWLMFALAHARRWERATGLILLLLIVPPLLTYAAVLTNGWHGLWWTQIAPDPTRPFVAIAVTRGPLFWLHFTYSYACVALGLAIFVYSSLEAQVIYRSQARLVVIGALFPIVGNIAYLLGVQVRLIDDPTPFLFSASGAFMFFATRHYQLLDLTPIAQQEIFDEMPDGMVVVDRRGLIVAINPPAARLLGGPAGAWVGQTLDAIGDRSVLARALQQLFAEPARAAQLAATHTIDTGTHMVEARLRQIAGRRARAGALVLLRDVTSRAQLEQKLERQLTELTLVNQIATVANAAIERDDLLRTITGAIVRTIAWDRVMIGVLQPDGATLRVTVDDAPHAIEGFAGTLATEPAYAIIFETMRAGAPRLLRATDHELHDTAMGAAMVAFGLQTMLLVPLRHGGVALGVLGIGHIAAQTVGPEDLRLYETVGTLISDAITRANLYEAANAASTLKSAFLATVSHELRTPLTSIIGYAEMLDQGVFGAVAERMLEPLDHIRSSGQMLLQLINDLLDFSKIEAGHLNIDLYPVDVATVVRSVAGTLQPQITARNLRLELDLAPDLPLVYANSGRLEQVLTNLVANAIKFTERGSIRVRTRHGDDRVRIVVEDSGIGIAPEQLGQIFEPFHQIDNQLTRRFGGTGLGLAIARRLIELMDGTLTAESTPGAGSTFMCELPAVPVQA